MPSTVYETENCSGASSRRPNWDKHHRSFSHGNPLVNSQAAQPLVVRSYYFLKKSLCQRSARERRHRDIVTAVIYCYITTELTRNVTLAFQHMEVLCYIGLNLQRFVWGKTLIGVLAEILIFLRKKWLTSMLCYLFYCHPAFQRDTKPFKRIIAFWVSSPKKE